MIKKITYSIVEALKQIGRNFGRSFAAFLSITLILFILGIFFSILVNINNITESAKKDFGVVQVFLRDEVNGKSVQEAEIDSLVETIASREDVAKVVYKTKSEALEELKAKWGENGALLNNLNKNPLPNTIVVDMTDSEKAETFVQEMGGSPYAEEVSYYKDTVDKIISVSNSIKIAGIVLIIILIFVAVLIVSNTIKLVVDSRKREIEIMKNVGATNWFIRGPFLVEGIIIGLFAAGVGAFIIGFIYHNIFEKVSYNMLMLMQIGLTSESFLMTNLVIIFVSLGVSIGAFGSLISVRKYLN